MSKVYGCTSFLFSKLRPDFREQYVALDIENDTVIHIIRLRIKSMSATSGPPIGPVLGQYAIPISKFCSEFNERTKVYNENVEVFVTLYHFADGNYMFELSSPVSSMCFKRAAGIKRGYGLQMKMGGGFITPYMFFEAVKYKAWHEGGFGEHSISSTVSKGLGSLRSIGINIALLDDAP
jgi:large subunit ribosomal protein L11